MSGQGNSGKPVGGGLGGEAVVLKTNVITQGVGLFPAVAEGRIGNAGVETRSLRRVQLS